MKWTLSTLREAVDKLDDLIHDETYDGMAMADKISSLDKHLKEVKAKFDELKNSGIDEEILIIYLQNKTKLSRRKVKEFLNNTEEFFNKLVSKEVAEEI